MTREQAQKLLPIIQAFAEGKKVQVRTKHIGWIDAKENPDFNTDGVEWRIKPEPREFWVIGERNFSTRKAAETYQGMGPLCKMDSEIIHVKEVLDS